MIDRNLVYDRPVFVPFEAINSLDNVWRRTDNWEPVAKAGDDVAEFVGIAPDMERAVNWLHKLSNPVGYVTGVGFKNGKSIDDHCSFYEAEGISIWRLESTQQTLKDRVINMLGGLV